MKPSSSKRLIAPLAVVTFLLIACACGAPDEPAMAKEMSVSLGKGVKIEFVLIQAGPFMMGSDKSRDNEKPAHKVTITKPFYMSRFEVTQEQYQAIVGNNPSGFKGTKKPVENVSWNMAARFCKQLSEKKGKTYRLPTEAEWEYACRAGTTTKYSFGDSKNELEQYAWCKENSGKATHKVGQKKPNAWGLYDMHGNVWEWCRDWYDKDYYSGSRFSDPQGPDSGKLRVQRGGSWYDAAWAARSTIRARIKPNLRDTHFGLRICMDP